jgi:spore maturation protein CgeB
MRIFIAVRHASDPRQYYGGLWSSNFYPALRQLGHELVESQTDLAPASRFMTVAQHFTEDELRVRQTLTESILSEVRAAHRQHRVDLFLSYFYNSHFDPAGFEELRKLGIPSVNFYCNSIYQFELVRDVARAADYAWHAERDARRSYLDAGANPVWVQMAADPEVYRPEPAPQRKRAACFVGQRYADRDRWVAALVRSQVPVELYGPGWGAPTASRANAVPESRYLGRDLKTPGALGSYVHEIRRNLESEGAFSGLARTGRQIRHRWVTRRLTKILAPHARGAVSVESIRNLFSSHEAVLNFSNVWADGRPGSALVPHVRLRDFEAPMCRAAYITAYTDELAEFYVPGKEVETYSTAEELVDKTRFLLANPSTAERLREAGYQRALKDHTWVNRFKQLFSAIEAAQ